MSDAKKPQKVLDAEAANKALDEAFKGLKFKSPEAKKAAYDKLQLQLDHILECSGKKPVCAADLKPIIDQIIVEKMGGDLSSVEKNEERAKNLAGTDEIAQRIFLQKDIIGNKVDTLLSKVGVDSKVLPARKLQVMEYLQKNVAAELNREGATEASLQDIVLVSLTQATGGKFPDNVKASAGALAHDIWKADEQMKTQMDGLFAKLQITDKAQQNKILASINEKIWPEILCQDIPDKKPFLEAALIDAISQNADLNPEGRQKLVKLAHTAAEKIDAHTASTSTDESRKLVSANLKKNLGDSFLDNVHVGTGTAVGAGAGAALAVAVGDTNSTLGVLKGLGAFAVGTGIGAAYDNGAFDSLLKPSQTPNNGVLSKSSSPAK